jgi:hypothetical protein
VSVFIEQLQSLNRPISEKIENHCYVIALHIMSYIFVRVLQALKVTPAMPPDVTKRLWETKDIIKCRKGGNNQLLYEIHLRRFTMGMSNPTNGPAQRIRPANLWRA